METGEFHWTDGWYFKRNDDGSVRIRKAQSAQDQAATLTMATIPPNEWASIIAHVAKGGEAQNYAEATRLHAGQSSDQEWRDFALMHARVHPDGSLSVVGAEGEIPARSFSRLYAHAARVQEPASAFDVKWNDA